MSASAVLDAMPDVDHLEQPFPPRTEAAAAVADARVIAVIVNYRTADLTIDCVHSLEQLETPVRIIVVDNNSDDGSMELLEEKLPHCRIIQAGRNGGYTAGVNLGIDAAIAEGAEYVLTINSDTVVVNPRFVTRLVDELDRRRAVGAVGPRVHLRRMGNVQNTVLRFPWVWRRIVDGVARRIKTPAKRSGEIARDVEVLNGVCVLFRTRCLKDVGTFDERMFSYGDEAEWSLRARRARWTRRYLPIDSILHMQKATGYERGSLTEFLLKRNLLYFLLKDRRFIQGAIFAACSLALCGIGSIRRRDNFAFRLFDAYRLLWLGRVDAAMGRPTWAAGKDATP